MKTHINVGLQIKKKKLLGVGTSSLFALGFIVFGMYSSTLNQSPAYAAGSPTDFVTTWKTDNPGTSNSSSITIPTEGTGYNYEVDWDDDGTFDQTGITGDVTHDFGVPGEYTIRIRGDFPQIYFTFPSDNTKLIRVDQWGTNPWRSMQSAFYGADNLAITATDTPDLSNVTDTSFMFYTADFTGDLSNWNVSNVTDMNTMFASTTYNGDLSNWNVSNVANMAYMFQGASAFTGDLSSWNVSNVTDMTLMFSGATAFNSDLSSWNVGNVTSMYGMFTNAGTFNTNLSNWNVSNVYDMTNMLNNTNLSVENYDATLTGWSGQILQSGVSLGAQGLTYCNAINQRQSIIDTYGWTISGDSACVIPVEQEITDTELVESDGKKQLRVVGTGLIEEGSEFEATSRSLVSLNGEALPFCADGTGVDAATWVSFGVPSNLVSDSNPCYYLMNSNGEYQITPTEALIWLPNNFDEDFYTVSVNGSNTYTFNATSTGGETPVPPAAPGSPTNVDAQLTATDQNGVLAPIAGFMRATQDHNMRLAVISIVATAIIAVVVLAVLIRKHRASL